MSWQTVARRLRAQRRRLAVALGLAPKPVALWKVCPVCHGPSGDYQSKRSREAFGNNRYMCFECAWGMFFATVNTITDEEKTSKSTKRPTQTQPYR